LIIGDFIIKTLKGSNCKNILKLLANDKTFFLVKIMVRLDVS